MRERLAPRQVAVAPAVAVDRRATARSRACVVCDRVAHSDAPGGGPDLACRQPHHAVAPSGSAGEARGVLVFGLLPDEDARVQAERYAHLVRTVEVRTGLRVELVQPQSHLELLELFGSGKVDLAYFGGYTFVLASERFGAKPLVMRNIDANFVSHVLVASGDETTRSLSDLKGRRFSFGARESTSGHIMPRLFFSRLGITPESFVFFLLVLGGLLWAQHRATAGHELEHHEFLLPTQTHIAQARRDLLAIRTTVIIVDMATREDAAQVASKLLESLREPMSIAGTEVSLSASIGITVMPSDSCDPESLIRQADMALYRAKEQGRNGFRFFVDAMNQAMVARMDIERSLRSAIDEDRLELHYQPQVELDSGRVTCVEALLRMRHQDGSTVPPGDFIPVADATGLIMDIGGWVLTRACSDMMRLRREQGEDLTLSVNLSARQFRDPLLIQRIRDALETSALPPSALKVEITETTLIEDIETTKQTLEALRMLGVNIAIDDFGIGYSSLNYLKQLAIDALKIDRSFVRDIETDAADRSIVQAILAMAHSLSLRIVAEGIETRWQRDYLADHGCTLGQGYLFSRPVPPERLDVRTVERSWPPSRAERGRPGLHVVS